MTNESLNILSKFDMTSTGGLVMVNDIYKLTDHSEILAISQAKTFGATAVYFRKPEAENRSIPQIYIFDEDSLSNIQIESVHKDLWSSGVVPLFYIVSNTSLKIFNCHKSVEQNKKTKRFKSIPIATFNFENDVVEQYQIEKFSSRLFDTGVFWEQNSELIHFKNSPYKKLLQGLEKAKNYLSKQSIGLSDFTINKVLIIGILLKYLEEKQDEHGTKLLEVNRDLIDQFPDSQNFVDILKNGHFVPFLKELNKTLNGNLFNLTENEKDKLQEVDLNLVADIFDGTIDNNQFVLWRLYSFNKLPIELISSVYEAFLTKEKSIVYTPPYLANTLIDECMPLHKSEELFSNRAFKVLDPACGSGIFLVAAFKRMVEWDAINKFKQTGILKFPEISEIKQILRNNIFGVDVNKGATLISMFSLNITLCEKLTPMEVWQELQFENLSQSNIITDNFFSYYNTCAKDSFSLVIGNPPFNPPNDENNKKISNGAYLKYLIEEYQHVPSKDINDHNLALIFQDKTRDLIKETGQQCLILPSSAFLYNTKSVNYRNRFFKDNTISKVYDFTHLSDKIFVGANVAVIAVVSTKEASDKSKSLQHIVVKRSSVAEERFYFEIDHYDVHSVNSKLLSEFPFIWKINLLGGGRILNLIKYLQNIDTLKSFLVSKKEDGWRFGEGYQASHNGDRSEEWLKQHNFKKADYLTGKLSVITETFNHNGYDTFIENKVYFQWPRTKIEIYKAPHILFKGNLGIEGLPVHYVEKDLIFKDKITGIHAPKKDEQLLKEIYCWLKDNSKLLRFIISVSSTQAGITMSSKVLLSKDILELPYPDRGEISLSSSEKVLIDDVLKYGINSKQSVTNSPYETSVKDNELKLFGKLFCEALNPIYANDNNVWFSHGYQIENEYTIYAFCYGIQANWKKDILNLDSKEIFTNILKSTQGHIKYTRVLRKYLHIEGFDVLVLIKPSTMRYWLGSIALRDADETFTDLKSIGK